MVNLKLFLEREGIGTDHLARSFVNINALITDYTVVDFQLLFHRLLGMKIEFTEATTATLILKHVVQQLYERDFEIGSAPNVVKAAQEYVDEMRGSGQYEFLWKREDDLPTTTPTMQSNQPRSTNEKPKKVGPREAVKNLLNTLVIEPGYLMSYDQFVERLHIDLRHISTKMGRMTALRTTINEDVRTVQWVKTTSKWHVRTGQQ